MDIFLAVCQAFVAALAAFLGVHVTLHPPGESIQKIRAYKVGFILCGIVACSLIGIQTWRNDQAQNALRGQLTRIETNTKTPPAVQVTNNITSPNNTGSVSTNFILAAEPASPSFVVNTPFSAVFTLRNAGPFAVTNVHLRKTISIRRDVRRIPHPLLIEDQFFESSMKQTKWENIQDIPAFNGLAVPDKTAPLSEKDITEFEALNDLIQVMAELTYRDPGGNHDVEMCKVTLLHDRNIVFVPCFNSHAYRIKK